MEAKLHSATAIANCSIAAHVNLRPEGHEAVAASCPDAAATVQPMPEQTSHGNQGPRKKKSDQNGNAIKQPMHAVRQQTKAR